MIRVAIEQGINSINRDISKAAGELSDEGMKCNSRRPILTAMRVSLAMNELVPMEVDEWRSNLPF